MGVVKIIWGGGVIFVTIFHNFIYLETAKTLQYFFCEFLQEM